MSIIVKEKDIVIPGEALAEGLDFVPGENTYRENEKIHSGALGLVSVIGRVIKVTSLAGPYLPKVEDKIIGTVIDITFSGWRVDTYTAYSAMLNVKDATTRFIRKEEDLSKILTIGDSVFVQITNVTSQNLIDLTMKEPGLQKLTGGRIIRINSNKIPRVIGKQGSMITLIRQATGTDITVGQNGLIWIRGAPDGELLAERAIRMIEQRAHQEGLTERVEKFLSLSSKTSVPRVPVPNVGSEDL